MGAWRSFWQVLIALAATAAASSAFAGVAPNIFGPTAVQSFTSGGVSIPSGTTAITITLDPNGQTIVGGRLQSVGFAGADAADFSIVRGGTCVPGTTVLAPITSTTGQSCTVNVRYTPSTSAAESAFLTAVCQPVAMIGGFVVACNSLVGNIASLAGSVLAIVAGAAPIPTLSAPVLGVVAGLVFLLGAAYSLRRPRR